MRTHEIDISISEKSKAKFKKDLKDCEKIIDSVIKKANKLRMITVFKYWIGIKLGLIK